MKKFTIKGVLDGFRSSVPQPVKPDQEIVENLRPEHFQVKKVSDNHINNVNIDIRLLYFIYNFKINQKNVCACARVCMYVHACVWDVLNDSFKTYGF